jgi:hypothetical protein
VLYLIHPQCLLHCCLHDGTALWIQAEIPRFRGSSVLIYSKKISA